MMNAPPTTTSVDETKSLMISPLEKILRLRGSVDTGYGRGGATLGFPTANLPSSLFQTALETIPTGVYLGWAWIEPQVNDNNISTKSMSPPDLLGRSQVHKAAVNIGYSPTFEGNENKEKIVEAHIILPERIPDFYHHTMRLLLVGFVRPEKKFTSLAELVDTISQDVITIQTALEQDSYYAAFANDSLFQSNELWIGQDGGNLTASWEFDVGV
jgi:riboflavin kinase